MGSPLIDEQSIADAGVAIGARATVALGAGEKVTVAASLTLFAPAPQAVANNAMKQHKHATVIGRTLTLLT